MSSLQCPARILVARHGEADHETGLVSNDGGSLSALGRRQARELGESLRGERVARVWTSPLAPAVQTAELAASVLGTDVVVREGIADSVGRVQATLQAIADEHRGETVLVVSHAGAILASLPPLVGLPRANAVGASLRTCGVVALEVDADGWRLISWDDSTE